MIAYLNSIKTTCDHALISRHLESLKTFLNNNNAVNEIQWQYKIPELGEGGSCSLFGNLQDEPFDLRSLLLKETQVIDANLANSMQMLAQIVDYIVKASNRC